MQSKSLKVIMIIFWR